MNSITAAQSCSSSRHRHGAEYLSASSAAKCHNARYQSLTPKAQVAASASQPGRSPAGAAISAVAIFMWCWQRISKPPPCSSSGTRRASQPDIAPRHAAALGPIGNQIVGPLCDTLNNATLGTSWPCYGRCGGISFFFFFFWRFWFFCLLLCSSQHHPERRVCLGPGTVHHCCHPLDQLADLGALAGRHHRVPASLPAGSAIAFRSIGFSPKLLTNRSRNDENRSRRITATGGQPLQ